MKQISLFNLPRKINYKEFNEIVNKWEQEEAIVMQIYNSTEDLKAIKTYISFYMRKLEEIEFISISSSYEEKLLDRCMRKYKNMFKVK